MATYNPPPLERIAHEYGYRANQERMERLRHPKRVTVGWRRPHKHVQVLFGPPPHTCVRVYGGCHHDGYRTSVLVSILGLWVQVYARAERRK